jgi:prolipoprotein diacylglyceryltransferase
MNQIIADFGKVRIFGFELHLQLFGYGVMVVLGFVAAVLLARRRARLAGERPEHISAAALLALLGGVLGARGAYVALHWSEFAAAPNLLSAMLNITAGGLVYYGAIAGGAIAIIAYVLIRRLPIRRYADIIAPCLMLGLAFGRAGCLLNGCCWGEPCRAEAPFAQTFPMVSRPVVSATPGPYSPSSGLCPAWAWSYEHGLAQPDDRLVNRFAVLQFDDVARPASLDVADLYPALPAGQIDLALRPPGPGAFSALAGDDGLIDRDEWAREIQAVRSGRKTPTLLAGCEIWAEVLAFDRLNRPDGKIDARELAIYRLVNRQQLTNRFDADNNGQLDPPERAEADTWLRADRFALLADQHSPPLKPAQLLGIINALVLFGLLLAWQRHRRIEGQVLALLMLLYPVTRFVLEGIRGDQPENVLHGCLTDGQWASMVYLVGGVVYWLWLARATPSAGPTDQQQPAQDSLPPSGPHNQGDIP